MSRLLCLTELLRRPARQAQSRPAQADLAPAIALGLTKLTGKKPRLRFGHPLPATSALSGTLAAEQTLFYVPRQGLRTRLWTMLGPAMA